MRKKLTKEEFKNHKMAEREILKKFDSLNMNDIFATLLYLMMN